MTKIEFATEFRALLGVLDDSYIHANLEAALELYENGQQLPPPPIFKRDPRQLCTHGVSLMDHCDRCMENYGEARTVMGEYIAAEPQK